MAELPENRRHSTSSSSSSSDLSVRVERELGAGNGSTSKDLEDSTDAANGVSGSSSSTASGIPSRGLSKVTTLPVDISHHSHGDKLESSSNKFKLERSKTERHRHLRPEDAAQIFDDKLSVQEKLKLLNRIATVKDDGTVEFEVPVDAEPEAFGARSKHVNNVTDDSHGVTDLDYIPPLNVVMLIVGTRGDVQPFVAIGKRLQDYGHRVRLATHSNFKEFVLTAGLEFYPLGGDPKVLAGYMVKNKGFLPSGPSEIPVQRNQMKEIINSLLPACKEPDTDSGVPFRADAIIANPPAYGHTHVAEALQIPIHIFFTMPWTPTTEFPHPLFRVKQQSGYRLSYQIVDSLIWLGIRDMINDLRKKKLKLRPVTYLSGSQGSETDIPHAYIWSPHLVPKPKDWGPKIDVVGFCFLDLASNYEPPESLVKWLEEGDEPIYIGFGSLPVQEPKKMTQTIVEALETTGQRGIINKGWGGLGELTEPKDSIYLLDNVPHDWLFLHCKAVVHHGGAGTTAAGLKAACPTTIVPFFGDQPFWGERVHDRGVGPPPIPVDEFSLPKLIDAIKFMLDPKVKERAVELAKAMENEDGVTGAVKAFFKQLPQKKPELDTEPSPSSRKINLRTHRDLLAEAIIAHDLPFSFVEYDKIRKWVYYLNPDAEMICRNTAVSDVEHIYMNEKRKLKDLMCRIPNRICLTSDGWTAITGEGYICLTAHFVDENWKLQSKILNFCRVKPPHGGIELEATLFDCLKQWGIDKKIFSLTLDNASANDNMQDILKTHLCIQNNLLCDGEFFHIRCSAHILNLIVQEGLKAAAGSLNKIRESIRYVRLSDGRSVKFKECVKDAGIDMSIGLRTDTSIRWNSTYLMLESALKYEKAFGYFKAADRNFKCGPSEEEWRRGEKICEFLEPFHDITRMISGTSYPTSNLYFMQVWKIEKLLQQNQDNMDDVIKGMSQRMKGKFDKYWKNYSVVLAFGAILDPRLKIAFLNFCYRELDASTYVDKVKHVKDKFEKLYGEYVSGFHFLSSQSSNDGNPSSLSNPRRDGGKSKKSKIITGFKTFQDKIRAINSKSEIDIYLDEANIDLDEENFEDFDVLQYWKINEKKYPTLSLMARDILSIPITTVASESAFSIGGRVLTKYRSSTLPEHIQMLICSRSWLHGYSDNLNDEDILQISGHQDVIGGLSTVYDIED